MESNKHISNFEPLDKFFEAYSVQGFLDEITDLIRDYSSLVVMNPDHVIPFETAWKINMLGEFHQALKKSAER